MKDYGAANALIKTDPRVVPLELSDSPSKADCQNCGGDGVVYIFRIRSGPYRNPPGGSKIIKWLDSPARGLASGWYDGETQSYTCPRCSGDGRAR